MNPPETRKCNRGEIPPVDLAQCLLGRPSRAEVREFAAALLMHLSVKKEDRP
jgi:hypothetical protein